MRILSLILFVFLLTCSAEVPADRALRARDGALRYFAEQVEVADPGWSFVFGYLHRRFGLEATTASGQSLHLVPAEQSRSDVAALFLRVEDPAASIPLQHIAAIESPIDRLVVAALHCGRVGIPPDWVRVLGEASDGGGYALTHAAMAGQWSQESGCVDELELAAVQQRQIELLVALIDEREHVANTSRSGLDITIEAMAMLHYLGAPERVEPEWIKEVIAAQRPDGGWPSQPRGETSSDHTTAVALWLLLETLDPNPAEVSWVVQR